MDTKLRAIAVAIADKYKAAADAGLRRASDKSPAMATLTSEVAEVVRNSVLLALNEFAVSVAAELLQEQFDETPTNVNADPVAIARDAGYRVGHNHAQRNAAARLTGKVNAVVVEVKREST